MSERPEIAPRPTRGRVITIARHVGLADTRPDGRIRLDALARILHDAADADARSGPAMDGVWLLRRLEMFIASTPRFRADVTAHTWCSGIGARWAERRTDLVVGDVEAVRATALWVYVDRDRGVPRRLPDGFDDVWGATAKAGRVSPRLRHPKPHPDARRVVWPLRATDLDVMGHVNNAAYWAAAEEELARRSLPAVRTAEIEFGAGLDTTDAVDLIVTGRDDGFACWLCAGDEVRASMLVGCDS